MDAKEFEALVTDANLWRDGGAANAEELHSLNGILQRVAADREGMKLLIRIASAEIDKAAAMVREAMGASHDRPS